MMNFKALMQATSVLPYLEKARFGLEKESQRVTLEGELAQTDHPSVLGCRSFHPYIQTDFSETQLELITGVKETETEVLRELAAIHDVALRSMNDNEMMWPLSMPPRLPEKDGEIQIAKLARFEDVLYRRYLARAYGKRKQMVSGIHFNFEYAPELVTSLYEMQNECSSPEEFKTKLYMKVARNFLRYRWLLTYLFGAAPLSEANYFTDEAPQEPMRSLRNSRFGYTNHADVQVSYSSLENYLADIAEMVNSGKLSEEKEFYAPIRLRGGKKMSELPKKGIRYVELRNIDLNPFERIGISHDQVRFIHYFMLFLLWTEEDAAADQWVAAGDQLSNQVAEEAPLAPTIAKAEGQWLIAEMSKMLTEFKLAEAAEFIAGFQKIIENPAETLAARWLTAAEKTSQATLATELAATYYQAAHERPYQLAGYREMELSTQILMFDAIQKGISLEVLDENDQFLKLHFKKHVEYVKNANMTAKDVFIVPLMMENKTVTKKVLDKAGFRVPKGSEFSSLASAEAAFGEFAQRAFVIKPKSTNYGIGITIFKEGATFEDYQAGLAIAFKEDSDVLVEEFLPGTEYRFFVLDGEVKAVLLRIPANIVGDGRRSIEELVAEKNLDPLRGTNHRSPLELIQLGDLEKLMLKEQGYTVESVPADGQIVYLRENSNISTGGDSIDFTDEMPTAYKKIAADAVEALGAVISGIDLIIPDLKVEPTQESTAYGIIEANFNPAMHMHIYPFAGAGQRLTMDVLQLLYPEVFEEMENC
ncbi:bifunctional glutamate--cysteine ligase GshA/glutathione synthetase GshB [Enterococcus sp. LJL120]